MSCALMEGKSEMMVDESEVGGMCGSTRLGGVLSGIASACISAGEKKFLRREAVLAAARAAATPAPVAISECGVIYIFEEMLSKAAAVLGPAVGLGKIRRSLLLAGRGDLAKRVGTLAKARVAAAHPDIRLPFEVQVALLGLDDEAPSESESLSDGSAGRLARHALGLAELAISGVDLALSQEWQSLPPPDGALKFDISGDLCDEPLVVEALVLEVESLLQEGLAAVEEPPVVVDEGADVVRIGAADLFAVGAAGEPPIVDEVADVVRVGAEDRVVVGAATGVRPDVVADGVVDVLRVGASLSQEGLAVVEEPPVVVEKIRSNRNEYEGADVVRVGAADLSVVGAAEGPPIGDEFAGVVRVGAEGRVVVGAAIGVRHGVVADGVADVLRVGAGGPVGAGAAEGVRNAVVADVDRDGVATLVPAVAGGWAPCCLSWEELGSSRMPFSHEEASRALGLMQVPRVHPFALGGLEHRCAAEVRAWFGEALALLEVIKQKMCGYILWSASDQNEVRHSRRVLLKIAGSHARRLQDDANTLEAACLTAMAAAQPVVVKNVVALGPRKRKMKGVSQR
jgi:hypothetical protein